jgi:hypothetical protein
VSLAAYVATAAIDPSPIASLDDAFARIERAAATCATTGERAFAAGVASDRLGYAFLGGYEAALERLVGRRERAALCATEEGGAHPRAIRTRLTPAGGAFTLDGDKTFATLATAARALYVVASEGERDGKNALRVVRVASDAPGVTITPRPEVPFAPEIPHATVRFDGAHVDASDVLPGDGYARYLKPFRTIEDVHVFVATLGYLARVARTLRWPALGGLVARAEALVALSAEDPSAPATHLALAGAIDGARADLAALPWDTADPPTRSRWERDQALLWVAETARRKRLEAARSRVR